MANTVDASGARKIRFYLKNAARAVLAAFLRPNEIAVVTDENKLVFTDEENNLHTVVNDDDSRLTDRRAPTAHGLSDSDYHSGTGTENKYLKSNADNLPTDAVLSDDGTDIDAHGAKIQNVADPSEAQDVATKAYADGLASGITWLEAVLDFYDPSSALPVGPTTGDRYIASASGNGWTENNIYEYNGATWDETAVSSGDAVHNEGDSISYTFNGSMWVVFISAIAHNNTTGIQGGEPADYQHLTSAELAKIHDRQHAITSSDDHTSSATEGQVLIADENGLPVDGSNTDAEVAAAVSATHARQHSITSTSDHTSTATPGSILKANSNGLPATASASEVAASHKHNTLAASDGDPDPSLNVNATGYVEVGNAQTEYNEKLSIDQVSGGVQGLGIYVTKASAPKLRGIIYHASSTEGLVIANQRAAGADKAGDIVFKTAETPSVNHNVEATLATKMILTDDGKLGVNTDTPGTTFDVNGNATIRTIAADTSPDESLVLVSDSGVVKSAAAKFLNGFVNRTDSTLALNTGTRVFTIAPASSSFVFYSGGVKYTKSTGQTTTIPNTVGLHFIYFDTNGALQNSTSAWDITSDNVPVATIYWNGSAGAINDERHGYRRDRAWHQWAHDTLGTRWESGLSGTFDNTTLSITSGKIHDEDIDFTITGPKTNCALWFRNSGAATMTYEAPTTKPYADPGGTLRYDNGGTLSNVSSGSYVVNWVYATTNPDFPIYVVVGQAQYASSALADAALPPSFPNLPVSELKLIYSVKYRNVAGTPTYISSVDYRQVSNASGTSYQPTAHNGLTGLGWAVSGHNDTDFNVNLNGDNKVGIGTASPSVKAHVVGDARIDNAYPTIELYNGATWLGMLSANKDDLGVDLYVRGDGDLRMSTNATTRAIVKKTTGEMVITAASGDQLTMKSAGRSNLVVKNFSNSSTPYPKIALAASRGSSVDSVVQTQNNDILGIIDVQGVNSSNAVAECARIFVEQDGAAGATYVPGRILFKTGTASAAAATKMTLTKDGYLGVGVTPKGIVDFVKDIGTDGRLGMRYDVGMTDDDKDTTNSPIVLGRTTVITSSDGFKQIIPYSHTAGHCWHGQLKVFARSSLNDNSQCTTYLLYADNSNSTPNQQFSQQDNANSGFTLFIPDVVWDGSDTSHEYPGLVLANDYGSDIIVMWSFIGQVL